MEDMIDIVFEAPVEEVVDIEELIQYFPGYEDPFFYQRKSSRRKKYHTEYKGELVMPINPGTQPDIEIRW